MLSIWDQKSTKMCTHEITKGVLVLTLLMSILTQVSCARKSANPDPVAVNENGGERIDTVHEPVENPVSPRNDHTCQFGLSDGETLASPTPGLGLDFLDRVHFQKLFPARALQAIERLSIQETLKFARSIELGVYKVTTNRAFQCANFALLDQAPPEIHDVWTQSEDELSAGYILGIYIPRSGFETPDLQGRSGLIMLRPDTARWTLVHELMHHFFEAARATQSGYVSSPILKQRLQVLSQDLNRCQLESSDNACTSQQLQAMGVSLVEISDLFVELLRRYPAEEMTIESILLDAFHSGRLKYVSNETESSLGYIMSSASGAKRLIENLVDIFEDYIEAARRASEVSVTEQVQTRRDLLVNFRDQVKNLEATIEQRHARQTRRSSGGRLARVGVHTVPTISENHDIDEFLSEILEEIKR